MAEATAAPGGVWLVAECMYTEADVRQFMRLAIRRARRRMRPVTLIFGATVMFLTLMFLWWRDSPTPGAPSAAAAAAWASLLASFWPFVAICFVLLFVLGVWQRRHLSKRSMHKFGPLQRARTFMFRPDGVSMREPLMATEYTWAAFCEWRELRDLFVLFVSENTAEIVLKRAIREPAQTVGGQGAALDRFRGMLRACIDARQLPQPGFEPAPVAPFRAAPPGDSPR